MAPVRSLWPCNDGSVYSNILRPKSWQSSFLVCSCDENHTHSAIELQKSASQSTPVDGIALPARCPSMWWLAVLQKLTLGMVVSFFLLCLLTKCPLTLQQSHLFGISLSHLSMSLKLQYGDNNLQHQGEALSMDAQLDCTPAGQEGFLLAEIRSGKFQGLERRSLMMMTAHCGKLPLFS